MFAVVKSGGKQYRVTEGQELGVDRIAGDVGDSVELPVGFSVHDGGFDLGEKTARVEILEHLRGDRSTLQIQAEEGLQEKTGHRQELTG